MGLSPGKKHLFISAVLILASINFVRTSLNILKSSKRLEDAQKEVSILESQKEALRKSNEYKKSDEYVEKIAREDLNMVRPGESVYVIKGPKSGEEQKSVNLGVNVLSSRSVKLISQKTMSDRIDNLKLWWVLFF